MGKLSRAIGAIEAATATPPERGAQPRRFDYVVDRVDNAMTGDPSGSDALQKAIEVRAANGWQVTSVQLVRTKSALNTGDGNRFVVVFERPVSA